MKVKYVGAANRSDLELIRLGILNVKESFEYGKIYDVPEEFANEGIKEGKFELVKSKNNNKNNEGDD